MKRILLCLSVFLGGVWLEVLKFNRYCSTFVTIAIRSNHGLIRLKKSSRKLFSSCVFSFVNNLYLILHACIQTFDVIRTKVYRREPNRALNVAAYLSYCLEGKN